MCSPSAMVTFVTYPYTCENLTAFPTISALKCDFRRRSASKFLWRTATVSVVQLHHRRSTLIIQHRHVKFIFFFSSRRRNTRLGPHSNLHSNDHGGNPPSLRNSPPSVPTKARTSQSRSRTVIPTYTRTNV